MTKGNQGISSRHVVEPRVKTGSGSKGVSPGWVGQRASPKAITSRTKIRLATEANQNLLAKIFSQCLSATRLR
jgi:hypothetical protein